MKPKLKVLAHLGLGQVHDLRGEREAALERYRQVLARPEFENSHEIAEDYLQEPYGSQ